uniref:Putative ovule protein n=1 Tax=Solanum chacoense TaxID=4108 RepID=A0A0V0HM72_SOLCH
MKQKGFMLIRTRLFLNAGNAAMKIIHNSRQEVGSFLWFPKAEERLSNFHILSENRYILVIEPVGALHFLGENPPIGV